MWGRTSREQIENMQTEVEPVLARVGGGGAGVYSICYHPSTHRRALALFSPEQAGTKPFPLYVERRESNGEALCLPPETTNGWVRYALLIIRIQN